VKHERATEEIRELAALYALGSMTQHEARSFEIHMQEGCAICEAEYHRFAHTIAAMGFAAEEVAAPDYIRDLLLARIEREGQSAVPATASSSKAEGGPAQEKYPPAASPLLSSQTKRGMPLILGWICVGAVLMMAFWAFMSWRSAQETKSQLKAQQAAAKADMEELQKQISSQTDKSSRLGEILAIAHQPEARIGRLIGQSATPSYAGAIFWDTKMNQVLVMGSFHPTPQGKVHQLWFFSPTAKIPVGSLMPDESGRVFMTLSVPKEAAGATAVVVTLEPDNGAQIPTQPYCAAGRID